MDCPDLQFHSQMAGWNTVSFATNYVTVVDDPELVKSSDGQALDPDMRGFVIRQLDPQTAHVTRADREALPRHKGRHQLAVFADPVTGEPARDDAGRLITMPVNKKQKANPPGLASMVGWRSNTGLQIAHRGSLDQVLDALGGAFPEVNVIRLDFNAQTARSPLASAAWAEFAGAAAARGYKLIIQNSDGELAGGFIRSGPSKRKTLPLDRLGPADALETGGDWKINSVRDDWSEMLDWFRQPQNAAILDAVAGWELVNEPMAYGKGPKAGAIYSRHMADLIRSQDWGGKRVLVGGLGASAQFADLDHPMIREAAGDALVWSVHMYPGWVVAPYPDTRGTVFDKNVCTRIGMLNQPGDDILITEMQLHTADGSLDPATPGKRAVNSFNMARQLPWFAEQGIGMTWWPPTSRRSDLLDWSGQDQGFRVEMESAAFAHWGWSRDETAFAGTGAGSPRDDSIVAAPGSEYIVAGVTNPHGLIFGMEGSDRLEGHAGPDMLYGGPGADALQGGDGDDWLFGDAEADTLSGGGGRDVLIDPEGANSLSGGAGDDHLEGSGALDGGEGDDVLIAGPDAASTLTGGAGRDRFVPDIAGAVTILDFVRGEDVLDLSMHAGEGSCRLDVASDAAGVMLSRGDLTVALPGIDGLDPEDLANTSYCKLGTAE